VTAKLGVEDLVVRGAQDILGNFYSKIDLINSPQKIRV
jgi:hypothetical protein